MILQQLLHEMDPATFLSEVFLRQPFAQVGGAETVREFGSLDRIASILNQPEADVMVCRQGERWGDGHRPGGEEALELYHSGYTLLVRHAERHDGQLAELAGEFQRAFHAPVNVHVYCTPAEEFGFNWHYDAEDVFILQAKGDKEYALRKNTVNPWPTEDTLPANMRFEREMMPLMKCLLKAGDWLYIPNGFWHRGTSQSDAVSVAVGVMTPPAISAFDLARERLLSSMLWRQRLPITGEASTADEDELLAEYTALFAQLGEDVKRLFNDPAFVRTYLNRRRRDDGATDSADGHLQR